MSLRDWLILIGVALLIGIFVDGYRRMRLAKKRTSELSFSIEPVKGYDDALSSELPNGGARVAQKNSTRVEPSIAINKNNPDSVDAFYARPHHSPQRAVAVDPLVEAVMIDQPEEIVGAPQTALSDRKSDSAFNDIAQVNTQAVSSPSQEDIESAAPAVHYHDLREKLSERPLAEEVIVINVVSKNNIMFFGEKLHDIVIRNQLHFGDMSIFHRYANHDGTGKILFSIANGMKPGTFDIDNMADTQTRVVSLFMGLPGPDNPIQAFFIMEETARQLALNLGGDLKDENMSVMTRQTIEHCRSRIHEFERKALTKKPALS